MNNNKLSKLLANSINMDRRVFLKTSAAGSAAALAAGGLVKSNKAEAFAYEPYPTDDSLETVVTSCAHNCGSRHALIAHKKGDVIVRLSSDDGRFQKNGFYGKDTEEEPQVRACLRGRSYRMRLYSAERLLYPMIRVGERGEAKIPPRLLGRGAGLRCGKNAQNKIGVWAAGIIGSKLCGCFLWCVA